MYHAPSKGFTIDLSDLTSATYDLFYSLKNIRELAGLPMTKYEREGFLTKADHAQKGIIDAAKALGIDLGASWGNEIDLTDKPG